MEVAIARLSQAVKGGVDAALFPPSPEGGDADLIKVKGKGEGSR